jgi:hypothetical protein
MRETHSVTYVYDCILVRPINVLPELATRKTVSKLLEDIFLCA